MKSTRSLLTLIVLACIAAISASAQQVYWSPASGTLQQGKANRLQLHFEGCEPDGDVTLPAQLGADFTQAGQSSSINMFNARVVQKLILEYQVSPTSQGTLTVPSFTVKTNKGDLTVESVSYDVIEATVGNTGMKPEDIFKSELSAIEDSIYEGEIFTLRYVLGVRQDYQNRLNDISQPQWSPVGVVTKGFEGHRSINFKYRNHNYAAILFETPAMATRNGIVKLPKVNQTVSMVVGRRRGFIFDDPVVDNYTIASESLELEIKPLPTGEPSSFTGAVGQFQFESTVVPEIVQVGEPVTWTLKLSGTGNWPQGFGLNPRNVAASFRSIQPDINKEISEESPFEGSLSEDIVLIPTKSGDFQFGPMEFSFFNPKTDRYESINIPEKTIVVNPIVTQNTGPSLQTEPTPRAPDSPSGPMLPDIDLEPIGVNLLSKPIELISAPIEGVESAPIPAGRVKLGYLAVSFAAPACLWLLIALVRSIVFDPNKARRKAFQELKAAAMALDDSESGAKAAQISWRSAAKRFWGINVEEPTSEDIEQAVSKTLDSEQASRWKTLWQNSDKFLFGRATPSFKEWQSELRDLLSRLSQPGRSLSPLLSHKAWFASLAIAVVLSLAWESRADAGIDFYNEGDFDKASENWKAAIDTNPSDWIARHNLGLTAAQSENWGAATAYWTSAFLLDTQSPEVRWNLRVALGKGSGYYPVLGRLVKGDGMMAYVSLFTPSQWERVAYISMAFAGLAFSAWVICLYFPGQRRMRLVFTSLGFLAVASVFGSNWAREEYGFLAKPDALVAIQEDHLKSVPTDLEVEQIESPLPEGSVCIAVKDFLGWIKVELPNGEQGWSRKENFAPLYGSLDSQF